MSSSASDTPDQDLYCLECGYNLRGLSGDPVRCPECGFQNPLGDVELPAVNIRKQLRRMETAPAIGALGLIVSILTWGTMLPVLVTESSLEEPFACCCMLGLLAPCICVIVTLHFRDSCRRQAGWCRALLRYYGAALGATVVIAVTFFGLAELIDRPGNLAPLAYIFYCIAILLVFSGIAFGMRPVHRWVRGPMDRLQRSVAIELARERVRRELRRHR